MVIKKALWALIGGVGGALSLALISLLTRLLNPGGNYVGAILISAIGFALLGGCVIGSVLLASQYHELRLSQLLIGIVVAGCLAGSVFPWGTFGFYLSLLLLGMTIAVAINGLTILAVKNVLSVLAGVLAGGLIATLWIMVLAVWNPSSLNSEPTALWVPFGLVTYGSTLGLLVSLRGS